MSYHLSQVGSLLKKAYERAKKEMGRDFYGQNEDGIYVRKRAVGYGAAGGNTRRIKPNASDEQFNLETIPRAKAGEDIGHELAMVKASALTNEEFAKAFSINVFSRVFENEYQVFILRATLYMIYRGIPSAAMHQLTTKPYYYYEKNMRENIIVYGPGNGIQTGTRKATRSS